MILLFALPGLWTTFGFAFAGQASAADGNAFDIGIIIDNRPLPTSETARADVDRLIEMLDRQIFIENIMVFERPDIQVICGVFGCPPSMGAVQVSPSLIRQITREGEARLFIYYIGGGRIEGLERELLFKRRESDPEDDVVGLSMNWLHRQLQAATPKSAVLMLDTSFGAGQVPCVGNDPEQTERALARARQNYRQIADSQRIPSGHVELSATTAVQAPHCDRFAQMLDQVDRTLFTKYLLKGIVDGEADLEPFGDEDRLIELGELADYLNEQIERAVRFQWGRTQNISAIGRQGKVLAGVDGRSLSDETARILERRKPPAPIGRDDGRDDETVVEPDPADGEGPSGAGATRPLLRDRAAHCRDNPESRGCHPCVFDPGGRACAERCQQDEGSDLCARYLTSSIEPNEDAAGGEPDATSVIAVSRQAIERPDETAPGPSPTCRWSVPGIAPYAAALVRQVAGDTAPSCNWAADRSEPELGPFAQIFTPIGWRLGRSTVQDAVICLLDCGRPASVVQAPAGPLPLQQGAVEPRAPGRFAQAACAKLQTALASHIGLPRWMPGALVISEALQAGLACDMAPTEPTMPMPLMVAIEMPPKPSAEPDGPTSDRSSDIVVADERLDHWPPHAADIIAPLEDLPPEGDVVTDANTIGEETPVAEDAVSDVDEQPEEEPFTETQGRVRWLQRALTVDNRNPGPIDGKMGQKTVEAIQAWRLDHDRADRTGVLTEEEFRLIIEQFGRRFGQFDPDERSF